MKNKRIYLIVLAIVAPAIVAIAVYFIYRYFMKKKATENALAYTRPIQNGIIAPDQKLVNLSAFLMLIRKGESSLDDKAYHTQFGGAYIEDLSKHPAKVICVNSTKGRICSDAFGAYQILSPTWKMIVSNTGLKDMSPINQDKAAIWLITYRGAYDSVINGDIETAIIKCRLEWASLPSSPYGQPTQALSDALSVYKTYGGVLLNQNLT